MGGVRNPGFLEISLGRKMAPGTKVKTGSYASFHISCYLSTVNCTL